MTDTEFDILTESDTNWLIKYPDGRTKPVSKSPHNRLLYEHGLWGLLKGGTDILVLHSDDEARATVRLTPSDDATEFALEVGNGDPIHIGEHNKSKLVEALRVHFECDDEDARPLVALYESIREDRIREDAMRALAEVPPFAEDVELQADGWLIHDHLLLTWEREFYHPNTTTRTVSGSAVNPASSEPAYQVSVGTPQDVSRDVTLDGEQYRLTDGEMEFLAKAMFGITEAPMPQETAMNSDDTQGTPDLTGSAEVMSHE